MWFLFFVWSAFCSKILSLERHVGDLFFIFGGSESLVLHMELERSLASRFAVGGETLRDRRSANQRAERALKGPCVCDYIFGYDDV